MQRRSFMLAVLPLAFATNRRLQAAGPAITVYKTATCGCCGIWVKHLSDRGFAATIKDVESTDEYSRKFGVPAALHTCHTAIVDGYTIEGHVPAADIQRLLKERPKAKGLAVPGMPMGSPGMEAGGRSAKYSVLLFQADGKTSVYREYPAK